MFGSIALVILIALVGALVYLRLDQPESLEELNEQLPEGARQTFQGWMGREEESSSAQDVRDDETQDADVRDMLALDDASDAEPSQPDQTSPRGDESSDDTSGHSLPTETRDRDGTTPYTGEEGETEAASEDESSSDDLPRRDPDSSVSRKADGDESTSSTDEDSEETSSSTRVSERNPDATATRERTEGGLCEASSAARAPDSNDAQDRADDRISEASPLGEESADGDDDAGDTDGFGIIQPVDGDDEPEAETDASDERSGSDQAGIIGLERGQARPPSSGSDADSDE